MRVGAYLNSRSESAGGENVDLNTISALLLKALGRQAMSLDSLRSVMLLPDPVLREAIEELRRGGLIQGDEQRLELTPLGKRAQYVVS